MTDQAKMEEAKWSISLQHLILAIVYAAIGAVISELIRNVSGAEKLTFSTTELVGFILSVVLSAASIVLAIAAIWLGKVSELSVIRRSDESIRLQNEVFIRTTEALQRIEASTGVTEKRIEDIISGRVGDISHRIAELASGRTGLSQDRKALEEEIKRSILSGVRSPKDEKEEEKRRKALLEKRERYKHFHQTLLTSFANKPNVVAKKLGDGAFQGKGDDLFDVVVEANGRKIAASAFQRPLDSYFNQYLGSVAETLAQNDVDFVYIAVEAPSDQYTKITEHVRSQLSKYKGDPLSKVVVVCGDIPEIQATISALEI